MIYLPNWDTLFIITLRQQEQTEDFAGQSCVIMLATSGNMLVKRC